MGDFTVNVRQKPMDFNRWQLGLNRLTANPCRLAGFCRQRLPLCSIAASIAAECQDQALLLQPGDLGNGQFRELKAGKILFLYVPSIFLNFGKMENEKHMVRFEIPEL